MQLFSRSWMKMHHTRVRIVVFIITVMQEKMCMDSFLRPLLKSESDPAYTLLLCYLDDVASLLLRYTLIAIRKLELETENEHALNISKTHLAWTSQNSFTIKNLKPQQWSQWSSSWCSSSPTQIVSNHHCSGGLQLHEIHGFFVVLHKMVYSPFTSFFPSVPALPAG